MHGRSSLNKNNDLTTYGTFVDMDPLKEKLSLRTLVSSNYEATRCSKRMHSNETL